MDKPIKRNLTTDIHGNYRGFYLCYIQDGKAYPTELEQSDIDALNDFVGNYFKGNRISVVDRPIAETEIIVKYDMNCPVCSGDLVWNEFDYKMHCTFCNYTKEVEIDDDFKLKQIKERMENENGE